MPMQLVLSATHISALKAAAEAAFPAESCGLLVGRGQEQLTLMDVVSSINVADEPQRHFLVDPQVQFDVLRRLRGSTDRIIGHYHSHPNGKTDLSRHDLAMADDPDMVWGVVALDAGGRAGSLAAYVCRSGQAVEVEIATSSRTSDPLS